MFNTAGSYSHFHKHCIMKREHHKANGGEHSTNRICFREQAQTCVLHLVDIPAEHMHTGTHTHMHTAKGLLNRTLENTEEHLFREPVRDNKHHINEYLTHSPCFSLCVCLTLLFLHSRYSSLSHFPSSSLLPSLSLPPISPYPQNLSLLLSLSSSPPHSLVLFCLPTSSLFLFYKLCAVVQLIIFLWTRYFL